MKSNKFERAMARMLVFCWKHKFAIGLTTGMIGAYCIGAYQQSEKFKAQEEAIRKEKEQQERRQALEDAAKAHYEDPANQLKCGGVVIDDAWDEGDGVANMILGQVAVSDMGALGEAIRERMASNSGLMDPKDLNDILNSNPHCDLVISVYPGEPKQEEEPADISENEDSPATDAETQPDISGNDDGPATNDVSQEKQGL